MAGKACTDSGHMLVRISEIEIHPEYREEYMKMASNVGATSVSEAHGEVARPGGHDPDEPVRHA